MNGLSNCKYKIIASWNGRILKRTGVGPVEFNVLLNIHIMLLSRSWIYDLGYDRFKINHIIGSIHENS